jgi:hypothetical protein
MHAARVHSSNCIRKVKRRRIAREANMLIKNHPHREAIAGLEHHAMLGGSVAARDPVIEVRVGGVAGAKRTYKEQYGTN